MAAQRTTKENRLLAALPSADLKRILPRLEMVPMSPAAIVYDNGEIAKYAYFPVDSIISLLATMENGDATEIAMVGNDGIAGVALFMGGESMPSRALVQRAGYAWRIPAEFIRTEFKRGGAMQFLLLRYTQALLTQMAQTAACHRHHTIDQQLCRWLLQTLDRRTSDELQMTHAMIASTLGVRREGVTAAAGRLQANGTIQYSRGHIKVLSRSQLNRSACECYDTVKNEYARLLDGSHKG